MPLIKYTDKGFLREEPFLNPVVQPTPVQTHSFIFPADEIVLYHKINLPDDAEASLMSDIKLVSAKVSLIAVKPQVFSEEFSAEFESTRTFILDSFETLFNNSNAPVIPFGSDGYAPFVNFQQDRNWKLPSGDFRRQIKFFTEHTDSTSVWDYTFYFPIIFRWEYWIAKLGVNNDFYDSGQPQNGQNEFWQHYHQFVASVLKWGIKSRLDINVLVNGVPTIIRSELDLSITEDSILDYNSNADWDNKEIKTSAILGTPSNTPCFVYGNKNTEVFGLFTKQSAWDTDEQDNISGVTWIEPYVGVGITARTRGSSLYPVNSESVFKGISWSATDDDGIGITDGAGNFVVYDSNGTGALIIIDGLDVTIFSIIDFAKLNTAYPGITKFTLYSRLYNSTLVDDETKMGEEIRQNTELVSSSSENPLCSLREPICPFNIDVFAADKEDVDELHNDKSDFYYYGNATIKYILLTIEKSDTLCGGVWEEQANIDDNTYGRFFAFGDAPDFSGDTFVDDYNKKYTGVLLDWQKILDVFGEGRYRMRIRKLDVFENYTDEYDQRIFCLKIWHCNLANRTVRIETVNEGVRGSLLDPTNFIDYGSGWKGQIRLKGVFRYKSSSYSKEFTQYGDSSLNKFKPYINEQTPKYTLTVRPVPGWMDWILSTNILQADEILMTDYNTNNRHTFVKTPVMNDGDITPRDNNLTNPLSDVEINFAYGLNSLRKRNSQ
jgi:hypothetical protein